MALTWREQGRATERWVNLRVVLLFVVLTAIATYPQARLFRTHVADHPDPYFSMWRLAWIAHQIVSDPRHLFESPIFHPERNTFAYSDAMIVPALVLAPLHWMRVSLVTTYNTALFAAFALSGFTMFVLARYLTGNVAAAIVAGAVFAFAPYRFEQYVHLEMQFVFWIPLALVAIHRLLRGGRTRDALALGALVALQELSGMYGAIFFATVLVVLAPCLMIAERVEKPRRVFLMLGMAAVIAFVVVAPYVRPYLDAERVVGERGLREIRAYSANFSSFLASPPANRLYGATAATFGGEELNLFPGVVAVILALVGLARERSPVRWAYVGCLLFAFEASRGFNGIIYPSLHRWVTPFRGLRVPARFDLLVNLSLAVLAAYGAKWLFDRWPDTRSRLAISVAVLAAVMGEYASAPVLAMVPKPAQVDSWLARERPLVLLELPLPPDGDVGRSRDMLYMYQATVHWQEMLNGYSGFFPESYQALMVAMRSFPDDSSMAFVRSRSVDRLILRGAEYTSEQLDALLMKVNARPDLAFVGAFPEGQGHDFVYRVEK